MAIGLSDLSIIHPMRPRNPPPVLNLSQTARNVSYNRDQERLASCSMCCILFSMPVDLISIGLKLLEFACDTNSLERILRPIASAIGEEVSYIERLSSDEGEPPFDEELEAIENLLGVAFVACQAHMNGVLQRIARLDDHVRTKTSLGIELLPPKKKPNDKPHLALLKRACPKMVGSYTQIEILWSLANYYKHHDEWPTNWPEAVGGTVYTITVISAAGLEQGSSGNLRTGAKSLGIDQFTNLDVLIEIIQDWTGGLDDEIRRKLKRK